MGPAHGGVVGMDGCSPAMLREQFAALQHEVEVFGGALLGKKEKKQWQVRGSCPCSGRCTTAALAVAGA